MLSIAGDRFRLCHLSISPMTLLIVKEIAYVVYTIEVRYFAIEN